MNSDNRERNTPLGNVRIILARPQQSGNIGAVARAIANHGLGELRLVDPPAFDPTEARWMAPHAHHVIDKVKIFPSVQAASADLICLIGASARERKRELPSWGFTELHQQSTQNKPMGILFGPEDSGLSNADLVHCQALMTLPTHAHKSLNLAQAVIVFGARLIAMRSSKPIAITSNPKSTALGIRQATADTAMSILEQVDYLRSRNPTQIHGKIMQWIAKSNLTERELLSVKGMLSKVYHGIRVRNQHPSDD